MNNSLKPHVTTSGYLIWHHCETKFGSGEKRGEKKGSGVNKKHENAARQKA